MYSANLLLAATNCRTSTKINLTERVEFHEKYFLIKHFAVTDSIFSKTKRKSELIFVESHYENS